MSGTTGTSSNNQSRRARLIIGAALLLGGFGSLTFGSTASADDTGHWINVDGIEYISYKHSGSAIHFNTPDTNPSSAYTATHTWSGNGSEHLPCPGGIHWINNDSNLIVSHCLPYETTTTTDPATTTTTVDQSGPTTTTTVPATTTTTIFDQRGPTTTVTLPETGPASTGTQFSMAVGLIVLGIALMVSSRRPAEQLG